MAINETLYTGRKFRQCIDNTPGNKKWNVFSWWTKAKDVEFEDGTTAETKLGAFKGVTTNENQTAGYAADVTLLKSVKTHLSNLITSLTNLVNSINYRLGGLRFYEDSTGKYVVGADSVPKKLGSSFEYGSSILHLTATKDITVRGTLVQDPSTGDWHEEGAVYGNLSEFDLTKIDGYNSFLFGDNVVAIAASVRAPQETVYRVFIPKEFQENVSSFNVNNVKITDFQFPVDEKFGERIFCRAYYNTSNGKLYIPHASTGYIESIVICKL